ncbi:unnamed protein product [Linum tenue]|uniref:Uncharacterized protein n=1 Tax=Linum tenue TaxID=586396 RepID=A0AAV0JD65_9ROSI|nr:unnamed protein product [Linum tenue]
MHPRRGGDYRAGRSPSEGK